MVHEIGEHDKVILHRSQAWHGLGVVVEDAPTPLEALRLANLDWEVWQWPLYATDGERHRLAIRDSVLNVRSDTLTELGIVGAGWQPIQNRELAEFCDALAQEDSRVLIESAGSIRNGRKVWFLIKGESFRARGDDEIVPYICASCGHDGFTAFRDGAGGAQHQAIRGPDEARSTDHRPERAIRQDGLGCRADAADRGGRSRQRQPRAFAGRRQARAEHRSKTIRPVAPDSSMATQNEFEPK